MKLSFAVKKGTIKQVYDAIEKQGLPNDSKWSDYNLLLSALLRGRITVSKLLVENDCRVNHISKSWLHTTPLHFAVIYGDVDLVLLLLHCGAWIDVKDRNDRTPFSLAFWSRKTQRVAILNVIIAFMESNIREDPDPFCDKKMSHLHMLIMYKDSHAVKKLLKIGARVNTQINNPAKNCDGYTPLHVAIEFAHDVSIVELLLRYKADVNKVELTRGFTPLHLACTLPSIHKIIETAISNKEIYNIQIYMCLSHLDINVIKLLIKYKCNVNARSMTEDLKTPLHILCETIVEISAKAKSEFDDYYRGIISALIIICSEIIDVLLENGANCNLYDEQGGNVLHVLACLENHVNSRIKKLVNKFIKNGANINKKLTDQEYAMTPLVLAVIKQNVKLVKIFLKYGADVNVRYRSFSLIHLAIFHGNQKIIDMLLNEEVDVNVVADTGLTPLHVMLFSNSLKIKNFDTKKSIDCARTINNLIRLGCNINAQDASGNTALHHACFRHRYHHLIPYFLRYEADINVKNNEGKSPLACLHPNFAKGVTILMKHAKKLQILGLHISKENEACLLDFEETNCFTTKFIKQCNLEVEKMKKIRLDNCYSLHNILLKDSNSMAAYARNPKLKEIIEDLYFKRIFIEYNYFIKLQYKKSLYQKSLLDPAKVSFKFLTNVCMPDMLIQSIFKYLNNADLQNLIAAKTVTLKLKRKLDSPILDNPNCLQEKYECKRRVLRLPSYSD